ncbi:MAG: glycosyltransferase family 9 protein [Planctomycetota bacterium]
MNWDRPRFLISRLSHIGDAILTLPLACQLKRTFPNCQIAWAAEGAASKLLRLHPLVDKLIAVPKGWLKRPSAWRKLRGELRAFAPDVSFDPQGLLKSAALARLSSAPVRIGFSGRFGREGSTWLNNRLVEPRTTHLVDRTLELLRGIDLAPGEVEFQLPACRESLARVQQWLQEQKLERFLLLNPGAGWPSKQWPAERFGLVARDALVAQGIPSVVVWAGEAERQMAEQAVAASGNAARLAPATSLPELAALASLSTLFVGGDTGPMHIAAAMGCRCVGLYGPTRPEDSGAYGLQHVAIQKRYQSGTSRERRRAPNTAMSEIQVRDVLAGIEIGLSRVLSRSQPAMHRRAA